jgi:2,3-bisphosphoglycerate-dependent phosphoglycerate mutase
VQTLYLLRHCQTSGQDPDAPLTAAGSAQAEALAAWLAPLDIARIVSSPYRRATASAAPLAARLALPLETDARLHERVLCATHREDWRDLLRASFADPDLAAPGGESARAAAARVLAAVESARRPPARTTALVTHGNLLAILLGQLDPRFGYDDWARLTTPDVFRLRIAPGAPLPDGDLLHLSPPAGYAPLSREAPPCSSV